MFQRELKKNFQILFEPLLGMFGLPGATEQLSLFRPPLYSHWIWCIFSLYPKSCQIKNLLVREVKDLIRRGKVEANHPRMYHAHFWTKTANNCGISADHASLKHRTYIADPVVIGALTKPAKIPFHNWLSQLIQFLPKSFTVCVFQIPRWNFDFSRFSACFMEI